MDTTTEVNMVAQQRYALFNLVIAFTALALFLALIPRFGPVRAQVAFGLLGITGFGPLFMWKRKGQIVSDERDQTIARSAIQITFAILWVLFIAGGWGTYYIYRNHDAIPASLLPLGMWLAWILLLLSHSTTTLVLYRKS
jgi:hypothetical protein